MNSTIDRMLTLTAGIAEQLLETKDLGRASLTGQTKLDIISLAELAATLPDYEPAPVPVPSERSDRSDGSDMSDMSDESDVTAPAPEVRYEVPVPDPSEEVVTEPETVAETVIETVSEPMSEPVSESLTETEPDIVPATDDAPVDITLWRQAFSINDLYLFRHELFRDSDTLLNQALGEIGQATSPLEVRDIMVNRYGIDPRRQAAKEFLNIVTSFFG